MIKCMGVLIFGIVLASAWSVNAAPTFLTASMDGFQVIPGSGDPDGTGTASVTIDPAATTINWDIAVSNIGLPPTAVGIHLGALGLAGPILVDLNSQLSGNTSIDAVLASEIVASPTAYYVEVANDNYPDGAIRGQLAGSQPPPVVPVPPAVALVMIGLVGLRLRRKPL